MTAPGVEPENPQQQPPVEPGGKRKVDRSWFARHKILTALGVIVVIIVIASIATQGGSPEAPSGEEPTDAGQGEADQGQQPNDDEGETEEQAPENEGPADPFADLYPGFDEVSESGSGDAVVAVPASVAMVTATHDGSGNFSITVIDEANQPTGDLLVNTIGSYSGTTAYGLNQLGEPASIQVTADGAWTLDFAPMSTAPELTLPAESEGDSVFRYTGDAGTWAVSHSGQSNFTVTEYPELIPSLLVNEIGNYSGSVPAVAGPAIVTITADGTWSIQPE
ncbi:TM2 domain-containing protein [Georgenia alba]|uniref:TM2 domain-containing protein n=1 Tax=Georgenia alba TaxID=2233858 RepID=A0ABW2Q8W7_9MICO